MFKKIVAGASAAAVATGSAMADSITNPTFTGVASDVGTGFNVGLGVAVAAGVALLAWGLFKRAARR